MNWLARIGIVLLLVTVSACFRKPTEKELPPDIQVQENFCQHNVEYLLGDMSLPIAATIRTVEQGSNYVMVTFLSQQSLQELIDFYTLDSERLGWHVISQFSGEKRAKFVFEKPLRMSTITIFDEAHARCVEIYAGERVCLHLNR
jgi:hypothetical protein